MNLVIESFDDLRKRRVNILKLVMSVGSLGRDIMTKIKMKSIENEEKKEPVMEI